MSNRADAPWGTQEQTEKDVKTAAVEQRAIKVTVSEVIVHIVVSEPVRVAVPEEPVCSENPIQQQYG